MIRELAWYIESGRFTDIVKELEVARNDVRQKQVQSRELSAGKIKIGVTKIFGHNQKTQQGL